MRDWSSDVSNRPVVDVSLVCTVRNEAGAISRLMESIAQQTVRPREVIVVDGGSRDGTQLHVEWWHGRLSTPLRVIDRPGANIAQGRNHGICAARASIVAVTDAGVRLAPDWLERIVAPFVDETVDVVSGFFVADAQSTFERAMSATVLPTLRDVDADTFLPSSRSVAFRRSAWERAGGYPAWLDYCEDLVFDLALRDVSATFAFIPDAIVHFRPRGSLRSFWHQYFRYARGDGKAGLWAHRHAIRYATYGSAVALVLLGKRGRPLWPVAVVAALVSLRRPCQRLAPLLDQSSAIERAYASMLVPIIRAAGDLAKIAGYPVGLLWRIRTHGIGWTWRNAPPSVSTADTAN